METNNDLQISEDFLEENRANLRQFTPKSPRRRGPYSKTDKDARRNEVYKLHFDFGYSARKISELMKVERNTINGDIDYWYSKISKDIQPLAPLPKIHANLLRLEQQRTRIREQLDKTTTIAEKITLERLIFDIDCKIIYIYQKLEHSFVRTMDAVVANLNHHSDEHELDYRWLSSNHLYKIPRELANKIRKMIKEAENTPKGTRGV